MLALQIALFALALPVLAAAGYLFVLSVAARAPALSPRVAAGPSADVRFDIVVPAHDEEAGIAATIASLRALDYPEDRRRIIVVADNCTDATAERARAAGASVLVRHDPERRGKGYALAHAFAAIEAEGACDAVVVIDADTTVSPGLLRAFARRFEAGAQAVQASYGVRNPDASWRTRLLVIALALFHVLRSLGRERLGLSAGLRGNGMGFTRAVLTQVPHGAFSIVEDVEYSLLLGEAGHRVHFVPEAIVLGDMATKGGGARTQRHRWERGRFTLARTKGPRLLREAIARRDPVLFDLALDLLVPPLASLVLVTVAGAAASLAIVATGGALWPSVPWLLASAAIAFYVLRGWALSGAGARGLVDLFVLAPAYVIWKLTLPLRRRGADRGEWVRTPREVHRGA
ncbi:MAG: glycosyltransferase family 2 protein [Polyangiaceae bacterium]